jgi:hypothetical protein
VASSGSEELRIEVEIVRSASAAAMFRYIVTGDAAAIRLPPPAVPERVDGLWRQTCFEAFIRAGERSYHEFNFAPSQRWAAYRFDDYRTGMTSPPEVESPRIRQGSDHEGYVLEVSLDLSRAQDIGAGPWRVGLSAVIEDIEGRISYWALAHPAAKPDFHHPDSFVLDLPAPA